MSRLSMTRRPMTFLAASGKAPGRRAHVVPTALVAVTVPLLGMTSTAQGVETQSSASPPVTDGPMYLVNAATGSCLDVPGFGEGAVGLRVQQHTCPVDGPEGDNFVWRFEPVGQDRNARPTFRIRNLLGDEPGMCIDPPGEGAVGATTQMTLSHCDVRDANQAFAAISDGDGDLFLSHVRTEELTGQTLCLDVAGDQSLAQDVPVTLYGCDFEHSERTDHLWRPVEVDLPTPAATGAPAPTDGPVITNARGPQVHINDDADPNSAWTLEANLVAHRRDDWFEAVDPDGRFTDPGLPLRYTGAGFVRGRDGREYPLVIPVATSPDGSYSTQDESPEGFVQPDFGLHNLDERDPGWVTTDVEMGVANPDAPGLWDKALYAVGKPVVYGMNNPGLLLALDYDYTGLPTNLHGDVDQFGAPIKPLQSISDPWQDFGERRLGVRDEPSRAVRNGRALLADTVDRVAAAQKWAKSYAFRYQVRFEVNVNDPRRTRAMMTMVWARVGQPLTREAEPEALDGPRLSVFGRFWRWVTPQLEPGRPQIVVTTQPGAVDSSGHLVNLPPVRQRSSFARGAAAGEPETAEMSATPPEPSVQLVLSGITANPPFQEELSLYESLPSR